MFKFAAVVISRDSPKSEILGLCCSSRSTLLAVRLPCTLLVSSWRYARPRAVPLAIVIRVAQFVSVSTAIGDLPYVACTDRIVSSLEFGRALVGRWREVRLRR